MRKFFRFIMVLAILGAAGYAFLLFVVSPDINNNKLTLTEDFITNINEPTICDTHFNSETHTLCTTFKTNYSLLGNVTPTYITSGDDILVIVTNENNDEIEFTFSFIVEENTTIRKMFNPEIYFIDLIE